jgi:hypothetical protein
MGDITARPAQLARRVRAATQRRLAPTAPPSPPPVRGLVEVFSPTLIKGWISVPPETAPTRVSLHLGNLVLASTYATEDRGLSGVSEDVWWVGRPPRKRDRFATVRGPKLDRRNSDEKIRTFSFRITGIWAFVKRRNRITVRVDGQPLPINGHGLYLTPPRSGEHNLPELRRRLREGHVLTQMGAITLSKRLDLEWQDTVMGVYQRVQRVLGDHAGYQAFLVYGSLLGAVREGGYIGHDADFDAAYVSKQRTGPEAAAELRDLALLLIKEGFSVRAMRACLHIHDRESPEHRIDLFHVYFDEDGVLRFPFGVAGTTTIHESDWRGLREIDFPGGKALIPEIGEPVVEHLYGSDWRRPKPGFNWNLDRTDFAREGLITPAIRTEIYWADFYFDHEYSTGSTFSQFIDARPDTPGTVVDLGCGDGRDACAFGTSGRTVLGLDQSVVGIEHAATHAERLGVADRVRFEVCDAADTEEVGRALDGLIEATPGPVLFYLRFFLHAIPEEVQAGLMRAIADRARPGDLFAAEFRTDKDKGGTKVHTQHYRRYQSAAVFGEALTMQYGFAIKHEEENSGLSPYGEEDPILYRVVAERR